MHQVRWLTVTAGLCLSLGAACVEATPARAVPAHLKYASRPALAEPALRSSAALVLDTTHASVLYARHASQALPIASITKLMTALVVM
ncbi:MAG: hypothetical protein JOZ67_04685, partial [Gammaproteobacteria bacterium]|nr:hypothetical protein [Gammaproteobacteria bacterium]